MNLELIESAKTIEELKTSYKGIKKEIKSSNAEKKKQLKIDYKNSMAAAKEELTKTLSELNSKLASAAESEKENIKFDIDNAKFSNKQKLYEIKNEYKAGLKALKDVVNNAFMAYYRKAQALTNDKVGLAIKVERKINDYVYKFDLNNFLLSNGLYIIIVLFIILSIIVAPIMEKGNLLTMSNILEILEQSSTRIFFALGVGGLILLGGTDLSIGRHVGMAAVITCIFLHPGKNITPIFGANLDFSAIPMAVRVILALAISIALCVAFSALAGFFTAKLNMHPFVTTLATQLIIFGLVCYATGTTSTGTIDWGTKNALAGRIGNFPVLIIYAVICIAVVWFIWNKTKFGKNMYAVGGNKEAAAVSGINVFKTTLLVFVFAGVLYGIGSFLEALRIGTAVATTGTGYELDAIAACVVGGISFSGGIGKLSGAVIGVLLFTIITYILTFLGLNTQKIPKLPQRQQRFL